MLYEDGLSVQTTLDWNLQVLADKALERGLRRLDKRHGWRRPERNVLARRAHDRRLQGRALERARSRRATSCRPSLSAGRAAAASARLRIGALHADLTREGFAWTHRASAMDLFKPGDLVQVQVNKIDDAAGAATVSLEQTPLVEGAILAIDNHTGQIKAMVGGWSFARSKFNRAVQAYRQMGSTFKPIVYTTAIDRGFTPTSIIVDEPVQLSDRAPATSTRRTTTTTSSRGRSRCAARSRTRATFPRSR